MKIKYILLALMLSTHSFAGYVNWSKPITLTEFKKNVSESEYIYLESSNSCTTTYEKFAPLWNKEKYYKFISKMTDTKTTLDAFGFFYANYISAIYHTDKGTIVDIKIDNEKTTFKFFKDKKQCEDMIDYYYK